ncbi:uncharacterized protein B0T23DRAFT_403814 [Neurospora hispaniola]|uniref:Uncharacterized protein n=1 Tax=Neurospora hispaniola TaxID=588809 RepID=A0AAJ0MSQ9_9PEZI|nr:hypothetical protein B0T23DRAFT_403814 [Neurospora hispaniola]
MIRDNVEHQTLDHWIIGDKDVTQHEPYLSLHLGGEIPANTSHRLQACRQRLQRIQQLPVRKVLRTTATLSYYDGRVCRKEEAPGRISHISGTHLTLAAQPTSTSTLPATITGNHHRQRNHHHHNKLESSGWIGLDSQVNPRKQKQLFGIRTVVSASLEAPGTRIRSLQCASSKTEILKDTYKLGKVLLEDSQNS